MANEEFVSTAMTATLLGLPAEVRLMILEYLIPGSATIHHVLHNPRRKKQTDLRTIAFRPAELRGWDSAHMIALLLVNHEITSEAYKVIGRKVMVSFDIEMSFKLLYDLRAPVALLQAQAKYTIGSCAPLLRLVRKVTFDISARCWREVRLQAATQELLRQLVTEDSPRRIEDLTIRAPDTPWDTDYRPDIRYGGRKPQIVLAFQNEYTPHLLDPLCDLSGLPHLKRLEVVLKPRFGDGLTVTKRMKFSVYAAKLKYVLWNGIKVNPIAPDAPMVRNFYDTEYDLDAVDTAAAQAEWNNGVSRR